MSDTSIIPPSSVTSFSSIFFLADSTKIDNIKWATDSSRVLLPEPEIILFSGKITEEWQIIKPLALKIEYSDGQNIASDDIFGVYGDGDTKYEAVEDYLISLLDYYQLIKIRAHNDKQTQALLNHLQMYISHIAT